MAKPQKVAVKLPFAMPVQNEQNEQNEQDMTHNHVRPKPSPYADRTWPAPRGTRRSFGKR